MLSYADEFCCLILHVESLRSTHSRGVSSLSHALDSIASCSDEEDSDEETGSSYYDSESYSNTTESTKKVWNLGKYRFSSIIALYLI